jgi:GNAT superfamily N-acetyltransferase
MIQDGYTPVEAGKIASIVTYLEMRSAPSTPPVLSDPRWVLRRHSAPDVNWYKKLFRAVGEEWLWFSRLQMPDEELRAIIHDDAVDVFALEVGGIEKGILELDRRGAGEIEIAFLGVTHDLIGQGAGRFLLARAIEIAWSHRPLRVMLHTCTLDHPRALEFYRRAGFVPYKREVEVAPDPRLAGTLPLTAAKHCPVLSQ